MPNYTKHTEKRIKGNNKIYGCTKYIKIEHTRQIKRTKPKFPYNILKNTLPILLKKKYASEPVRYKSSHNYEQTGSYFFKSNHTPNFIKKSNFSARHGKHILSSHKFSYAASSNLYNQQNLLKFLNQ